METHSVEIWGLLRAWMQLERDVHYQVYSFIQCCPGNVPRIRSVDSDWLEERGTMAMGKDEGLTGIAHDTVSPDPPRDAYLSVRKDED